MQTRDWCFTINNPEESDIASTFGLWENELCTYIVYQYERGEEGTLHMQGFVQMKAKTRLLRMSRLLARAHIEARFKKSTPQQAADYCKKEEGRVKALSNLVNWTIQHKANERISKRFMSYASHTLPYLT